MRMIRRPLPPSLTPLEIERAMDKAGILADVEAWLASMPPQVSREWYRAREVMLDDPLLDMAREALAKSPAYLDDFLRLAAGMMTFSEFSARHSSNS